MFLMMDWWTGKAEGVLPGQWAPGQEVERLQGLHPSCSHCGVGLVPPAIPLCPLQDMKQEGAETHLNCIPRWKTDLVASEHSQGFSTAWGPLVKEWRHLRSLKNIFTVQMLMTKGTWKQRSKASSSGRMLLDSENWLCHWNSKVNNN